MRNFNLSLQKNNNKREVHNTEVSNTTNLYLLKGVWQGIAEPHSHFVQRSSYLKEKPLVVTQYDMKMLTWSRLNTILLRFHVKDYSPASTIYK